MSAPGKTRRERPGRRELLTGNHAVSWGATLAGNANDGIVISAYPITPQTDIVKRLSDLVADGTLRNSKFIPVESEHSAMAVVLSASMTGARTFTATSSQGLLLMTELLWWAAGSRAPVVLANVNRAIGPGWSIWTDQQDSLAMRDTGWLQYYCADNQEVLDSVLTGFRIGEAVGLPVMVVLDAFVLSHTSEEVVIPDEDRVRELIPRYEPEVKLDPAQPSIFGGLTVPELYPSFRRKIDRALARVPEIEAECDARFEELFGVRYRPVTGYRMDDADLVLVASATPARTARAAVDTLREEGVRAGVVRVRRFRPFPASEIRARLAGRRKVAVLDRNVSLGGEGIFATEIKSALYGTTDAPEIHGFVAGLGGQDITPQVVRDILTETLEADGPSVEPRWVGVLPERTRLPAVEEVQA